MNLFRNVEGAPKVKSASRRMKKSSGPQRLSFHAIVGGAFVVIFSMLTFSVYRTTTKTLERMQQEIADATQQLQQVAKIDQIKSIKPDKTSPGRQVARGPSGLDGSWSSVMWKIATFTGDKVAMESMTLSLAGRGKEVILLGYAKSLPELRYFVRRLVDHIPGSEIVVSNHRVVPKLAFPLRFEMKANVN